MSEKKENFELELYEVIGIKTFRKMVFVLRDTLIRIIYFWMSKERINELLNDGAVGNNYSVNKTKGIKGFKDFKKAIIFNAFVHIIALVLLFFGTFSLKTFVLGLINLYCIILQRYNWIRVNRIIKRGEKREERQKEAILNDLKKIDSEVEKHSYKQEKKAKKTVSITYSDFCKEVSLEHLKQYKTNLENMKNILEYFKEMEKQEYLEVTLPKNKQKFLGINYKDF